MEDNAIHVPYRIFITFKEWLVNHVLKDTVSNLQVTAVRVLHQLYHFSIATSSAIATSTAKYLYSTTSLETVEKTDLFSMEKSVSVVYFLLTSISISKHAHHANLGFPSIL